MKKRFFTLIALILVIAAVLSLVGCNKYTYEPSDDFFNISSTFAGSGSTSRSFSFMTKKGAYTDECVVQIDPADKEDTEPKFNAKDNFELTTTIFTDEVYEMFEDKLTIYTAYTKELTPDTKYFYRVGCPDYEKWSQWGVFITDDGNDSFTFMHITDSQSDDPSYEAFSENIRKALSENPDSEFILSTGDQTEYGFLGQADWNNFFNIQDIILNETFVLTNGNHEVFYKFIQANFYVPLDHEGYYYAYEYGNCLFMVLDTNYNLTDQIEWMKTVCAASTKPWRVVALHKSPYSSGTHSDDGDVLKIKSLLTPFAVQHSVDLVLSGHDHIYARTCPIDATGSRATSENVIQQEINGYLATTYVKPEGAIYVSNRSIGNKFYGKSKDLNDAVIDRGDAVKTSVPIYSVIKVEGNKLTYTAYEYYRESTKEVKVFDCFEIVK